MHRLLGQVEREGLMTDQTGPEVAGGAADEADDRFVAQITVSAAQADELVRREGLDFGDHPRIVRKSDGTCLLYTSPSPRDS